MPRVDGFEAAPLLHARRPGMALVLCTGLVDDEVRRRAADGGLRRRGLQGRLRRAPGDRASGAAAPAERRRIAAAASRAQRPITRAWPLHGPARDAARAARAGRPARARARCVRTVQYARSAWFPSGFVDNLIYDACSSARRCCAWPAPSCTASSAAPGSSWAWPCSPTRAGNVSWSLLYTGASRAPYPRSPTRSGSPSTPWPTWRCVKLLRARLPHLDARLWLDGLMALLRARRPVGLVIVEPVLATTGGDVWAVVTNLAYPVFDTILAGLVLGAMVAGRGRLDRTWLCVAAGMLRLRRRRRHLRLPGGRGHLRRGRAARRPVAGRHAPDGPRRVAARRADARGGVRADHRRAGLASPSSASR